MTHFTPFDVADYLDNEETIAAYLTEALGDPDPDAFLVAVKTVARARGMTQLRAGAREPLQSPGARREAALRDGHESGAGAGGESPCGNPPHLIFPQRQ